MIEPVAARRIKLVGFDVDGVFTDGGLFVGATQAPAPQPIELKRFDVQDGLGVNLLKRAGLITAIVTGRAGEAARIRSEDMGVDEFVISGKHKLPAFTAILEKRGVAWTEACFVGDDLPDLPILHQVGLPIAVANAVPEVKEAAAHTTTARGGHGAVREFVEALLTARGTWSKTVQAYLKERGDVPRR
jgi:3-deoxy-D-manno-octulosonate 8-phosphate phosphatase (KDO 8-P phosphatase)